MLTDSFFENVGSGLITNKFAEGEQLQHIHSNINRLKTPASTQNFSQSLIQNFHSTLLDFNKTCVYCNKIISNIENKVEQMFTCDEMDRNLVLKLVGKPDTINKYLSTQEDTDQESTLKGGVNWLISIGLTIMSLLPVSTARNTRERTNFSAQNAEREARDRGTRNFAIKMKDTLTPWLNENCPDTKKIFWISLIHAYPMINPWATLWNDIND